MSLKKRTKAPFVHECIGEKLTARLEHNEADEKRFCYGEATYAEEPPAVMHDVIEEIPSFEEMKVY